MFEWKSPSFIAEKAGFNLGMTYKASEENNVDQGAKR